MFNRQKAPVVGLRISTLRFRLASSIAILAFFTVVLGAGAANATGGLQPGPDYCKNSGYTCVPGGYRATAATTGNGWAWRFYGQGATDISTGSGPHNCTLYAAWRLQQNGMANPGRSWGRAGKWGSFLGYNSTPTVGSIAWWSGDPGHVAYVEDVSGNRVRITADNYIKSGGNTDGGWIDRSAPTGYLHPHDSSASSTSGNHSYEMAFQANTGNLWSVGSDPHGDWQQGIAAGTSPSVTSLAGGGYEMAFQANTGELVVVGTKFSRNYHLGVAQGTSPSITSLSNGGFEVAFQANTGELWSVGDDGHGTWGQGMASGTSPSVAGLPGGGYEMAFQANTGELVAIGSRSNNYYHLGVAQGTSPSITSLSNGGFEVAFQANTGELWSVGDDGHGTWGFGMALGTSPSLTKP